MLRSLLFSAAIATLLTGCLSTSQPIAKNYLYKNSKGENVWSAMEIQHPGMTLLSPLNYHYRSPRQAIEASYFIGENEAKFVKLTFKSGEQIILPQQTSWSKGARYQGNGIHWETQEDRARLINQEGRKEHFIQQRQRR